MWELSVRNSISEQTGDEKRILFTLQRLFSFRWRQSVRWHMTGRNVNENQWTEAEEVVLSHALPRVPLPLRPSAAVLRRTERRNFSELQREYIPHTRRKMITYSGEWNADSCSKTPYDSPSHSTGGGRGAWTKSLKARPLRSRNRWMDGRTDREEDEGEIKMNRGRTRASKCGGWWREVHRNLGAKTERGGEVKKTKRKWHSGKVCVERRRERQTWAAVFSIKKAAKSWNSAKTSVSETASWVTKAYFTVFVVSWCLSG